MNQKDVVGKDWNVRSGVHEYGGLAATASKGVIYFSNYSDSRVYRIGADGSTPEPVTPGKSMYQAIVSESPNSF